MESEHTLKVIGAFLILSAVSFLFFCIFDLLISQSGEEMSVKSAAIYAIISIVFSFFIIISSPLFNDPYNDPYKLGDVKRGKPE